ncbi:MAG: GNAT family N-acetyltransferase [Oscillospiraceae bacterium]|nr:GNAT family N-acetyltransferase [Oscillospiraceae bacterium]
MENIIYKDIHDFSKEELEDLFLSVEWSSGHYPEKLVVAMKNFETVYSAWDGDKLIGSGRVIGDGGVSYAVTDIMVDRDYQNNGIGSMIMARIDEWFRENTDENAFVMLIANKPADRLYSRNNFDYLADNRLGMLRNQKKNK